MRKYNVEEFVIKSKGVHGDKYYYNNVEYIDSRTKVCIICPEHGEFWQTPNSHLRGSGCPKCATKNRSLIKTNNTDNFINKAKSIHKNRYDYSKTKYVNSKTKVCIICPEHGEFWQLPSSHLIGCGCSECGKSISHKSSRISQDEIIKRFIAVHDKKYNYSKMHYDGMANKVCIICPEHGEFWQTPHNHLKGNGCPNCKNSHLEDFVENVLIEENIKFIKKYKTLWLNKQHLDFYLPDYNIAIECQGEQHFTKFRFEKSNEMLLKRKKRDEIKKKLCEENDVKLLYFSNTIKQTECLKQKIIKNKIDLIKEIYG